MRKTSNIRAALTPRSDSPRPRKFLSSGSTVLNMHLSGTTTGGYMAGKYYAMIGDSSSGKTWLCFTAFAEAKQSPVFKEYRLIYDAVEDGADMDVERYFGAAVYESMEPPAGTRDDPKYSHTAEDFSDNLAAALDDGRPFIYVLDSIDGLSTEDDEAKVKEQRDARAKGKSVSGTYGMSKAKRLKAILRHATSTVGLRTSGSILIVLCQTIDNVGTGFSEKDRAGGNAITFFATVDMWLSVKTSLKKKVKDKDRPIGILTQVNIKKNRITGKRYEKCAVPILHSVGIDDTGGCVDYLVEEGHWKKGGGGISAPSVADSPMTREKLIEYIEAEGLERKLRLAVRECYREISEATKVVRKPRYE